jgi:hypothetical protein
MLPTRNVPVKVRISAILEALPSDRSFTLDELKTTIRDSGVKSNDGIRDYKNIHLKAFIESDGEKYRLK